MLFLETAFALARPFQKGKFGPPRAALTEWSKASARVAGPAVISSHPPSSPLLLPQDLLSATSLVYFSPFFSVSFPGDISELSLIYIHPWFLSASTQPLLHDRCWLAGRIGPFDCRRRCCCVTFSLAYRACWRFRHRILLSNEDFSLKACTKAI